MPQLIYSLPWDKILLGLVYTIGGLLVLGQFFDFAPRLRIRVSPRLLDASTSKVAIRIEVENISKVLLIHHPAKGSRVQILRYRMSSAAKFSEFLPFTKEYLQSEHMTNPAPISWSEADSFITTTTHWYPGDIVAVERVETIESLDTLLHIGVQVHGRVPWIFRTLLWIQGVGGSQANRLPPERWTTTAFVSLDELTRTKPK